MTDNETTTTQPQQQDANNNTSKGLIDWKKRLLVPFLLTITVFTFLMLSPNESHKRLVKSTVDKYFIDRVRNTQLKVLGILKAAQTDKQQIAKFARYEKKLNNFFDTVKSDVKYTCAVLLLASTIFWNQITRLFGLIRWIFGKISKR